jgi:DNA-binding transcriptional LysR family regulator
MNWNQLRYVLTIAEEKSITRAAQRLYLTQPSLSLSLAAQQLGITFAPLIFAQRQFYGEELCYFHIARVETSRPLALVYPRSSYQSAPLKAMLELFRIQVPKLYGL